MGKRFLHCILALYVTGGILLSGCEKEKDMRRHVYGTMIDSVTNLPKPNANFELLVMGKTRITDPYSENAYRYTTDQNGYFDVEFKTTTGSFLAIAYPGGSLLRNKGKMFWAGVAENNQKDFNAGIVIVTGP